MANFGWAHLNRVVSQAVFQKLAAGHPKFGVERELRASPWGLALIASCLDGKILPKQLGQVGGRVSAGMSKRESALNAHKQ